MHILKGMPEHKPTRKYAMVVDYGDVSTLQAGDREKQPLWRELGRAAVMARSTVLKSREHWKEIEDTHIWSLASSSYRLTQV